MEYIIKLLFVTSFVTGLNWYYGYDARFTIINGSWSLFILYDWYKAIKSKPKQ